MATFMLSAESKRRSKKVRWHCEGVEQTPFRLADSLSTQPRRQQTKQKGLKIWHCRGLKSRRSNAGSVNATFCPTFVLRVNARAEITRHLAGHEIVAEQRERELRPLPSPVCYSKTRCVMFSLVEAIILNNPSNPSFLMMFEY